MLSEVNPWNYLHNMGAIPASQPEDAHGGPAATGPPAWYGPKNRAPSGCYGVKPRATATRGALSLRRRRLKLGVIDGLVAVDAQIGVGHRVFETVAAVEEHHAVGLADPALGERLGVGGIGRRPLWREQEPLRLADLGTRLEDHLVGDRHGEALALADRAQDEEIAERFRHAQSRG